jgi:hypothetical protein
MTALPKTEFSRTLHEPLAWKNSRLVKTQMEQEISGLKQENGDPSLPWEHQFGEEYDSISTRQPFAAHDFPGGAWYSGQRIHLCRIRQRRLSIRPFSTQHVSYGQRLPRSTMLLRIVIPKSEQTLHSALTAKVANGNKISGN